MKALAAALLSLALLTGCDSFERTTYDTLAASKAVIDQAGHDYNNHVIPESACAQRAILDARTFQNAAEAGLLSYHAIKKAKGDVTAITATVVVDMTALAPLVVQVKSLANGCGGGK